MEWEQPTYYRTCKYERNTINILYTAVQKCWVTKITKKSQQGCIKLIKSDSKDIYNVTKHFYFKLIILHFLFTKES